MDLLGIDCSTSAKNMAIGRPPGCEPSVPGSRFLTSSSSPGNLTRSLEEAATRLRGKNRREYLTHFVDTEWELRSDEPLAEENSSRLSQRFMKVTFGFF